MSWDEWYLGLKAGDIVLWRSSFTSKRVRYRTVLEGPADYGRKSIKFPILQRSWTGRPTTVYEMTDMRDKISPCTVRGRGLATECECVRLLDIGFGRRSMREEVERVLGMHRRSKKKPGRALRRAARLLKVPVED